MKNITLPTFLALFFLLSLQSLVWGQSFEIKNSPTSINYSDGVYIYSQTVPTTGTRWWRAQMENVGSDVKVTLAPSSGMGNRCKIKVVLLRKDVVPSQQIANLSYNCRFSNISFDIPANHLPATGNTINYALVIEPVGYACDNGERCVGADGVNSANSAFNRHIIADFEVTKIPKPPVPTNIQASDGNHCDKVRITWDAASGAEEYLVYRGSVYLGKTTATSYDDYGASTSVATFRVRARNGSGTSNFGSDSGYKASIPSAPASVIASDGTYNNLIKITWSKSFGATRYIVLRNGNLIGDVGENVTEINDYTPQASANTLYGYEVFAVNDCGISSARIDGGYRCSNYSFEVGLQTNTPLIKAHRKNIHATIKNNGTEDFSGTLYLSWHQGNGVFIDDLDRKTITLKPGEEVTLQSDNKPIISNAGDYNVLVKYRDPDAYGACANLTTITNQDVRVKGKVYTTSLPTDVNGDPINMLTGEFLWGHNDFLINTIEGAIPFQRTYKSRADYKSGFGHKWTHSFNIYLEIESDLWTLHESDGNEMYFVPDGSGGSQARPLFSTDTLYVQSFVYYLKKKDGTTYKFNHLGDLLEIKFPSGNAFYFGYGTASNGTNRLENIIFPQGRNLTLVYDVLDRIIQVKDNAGRSTFYQYNSSDYLTQATNVRGGHVRYYYDTNAQLVTIKDARGNTAVFNTYNSDGQVVAQLDAYNKTSTIAYDNPVENATTFTNPLGYKTIYYHDAYYRLTRIENHLGKSRAIAYDGFSYRPKIISDENNDSTQFAYDAKGNITQVINALGSSTSIAYNSANYPVSVTNSLSHSVNITYNSNNKPTQIDFPNNSNIKIGYFGNGLPSFITNQNHQTYSFLYNSYGDMQELDTPTGSYVMQYDNAGKIISVRDRNGKTTLIETDNYDNVTKITDPLNQTIQRVFNENGYLTEQKDKNRNATFFEYDKRNLLTKIIDANANETLFSYDNLGRLTKITDAEGHHITYGYDELNRLIGITNHLGVVVQTFGYDGVGNRTWAKDTRGKGNAFTYNKLRQLLTVTNEFGHTDSLSYNTLGQVTAVKNAKGQTTTFTYDVMGWLATVTDPMNGMVTYTRNNLGNITNINDANGKNTQITYNTQNLPQLITYPGSIPYKRSFVYDKEGFLSSYTDEDGITATITRNDNYQATNVVYSNGKNESFVWDANGWLTSATNSQGTTSFTYDQVGNVTQINDVFGQDIEYTYDKVYNRTSITYPGGSLALPHTVTTIYNELNLSTQTADWLGNYAKRFYNDNYQLDSVYNSNGSSIKITYDDLQRITSYANREANGAIINQHLLIYDKNNRIVKDQSILPEQLTLSPTIEAYTRGDDGRLNQAGSKTYTHNKRGARTATASATTESFTWGETDLLTNYTKDGITTNNYFDAFGNRIKKEKTGNQTRYLLDLNSGLPQVLQEQDNAGNTKANYIYTPNALGWRLDENNKASFYAYSFNGHTLGLTNEAGLLTDKYAYDLFGDHAKHVGSSPQPFTYLGKFGVMEESKGFYHIRARFYDASSGAFISKDSYPASITNTQSLNRYHYGFNDPLTFVDVDGLKAKKIARGKNSLSRKSAKAQSKNNTQKAQDIISHYNLKGSLPDFPDELQGELVYLPVVDGVGAIVIGAKVIAVVGANYAIVGAKAVLRKFGRNTLNAVRNYFRRRSAKILEQAAKGRGNFDLGTSNSDEAIRLGKEWVGKGYTTKVGDKGGTILISKNKLRQFRYPQQKRLGNYQANFERRDIPRKKWTHNGHLEIIFD
ncbi:DUF6531 domain-containing protein [Microscilla marina]|uniref:RHS Repeat family n=1 Tax=Microscilla marina ATCC 23134 TaxID=313606 RepID=A1ZK10_MICM2|nr:DUF6531 domain-containing protein [Microscilla marina]EAY29463.1 RHS Repeat family [Microscilla marina ATCC 23134]